MKKIYKQLACLFLCIHLLNIAFAGSPGANIKFQIKGVKDTFCVLAYCYADQKFVKDTLAVDGNGKMIFHSKEKCPEGIYSLILPGQKFFDFVMDGTQNFSVEADTANLLTSLKIKGSQENDLFLKHTEFLAQKFKEVKPLREMAERVKSNKDSLDLVQAKMSKIDSEVHKYEQDLIKQYPQTFTGKLIKAFSNIDIPEAPKLPNGRPDSTFTYRYYKAHFWDNIDLKDDRIVYSTAYSSKLKEYFSNMIMQHPDTIIKEADLLLDRLKGTKDLFKYTTYYISQTYGTSQLMGMDAVWVHVVNKVYKTGLAFWADSSITAEMVNSAIKLEPLLLGKKAPDIAVLDTNDKRVTLYSIKAKYTILLFWDHDCSHCQKEVPKYAQLYEKVKSQGVEVFAVEGTYDSKAWKKYIREHNLKWINAADPYGESDFRKKYDLQSFPVVYLLDENKKILAKRIDCEHMEIMLNNMLNLQ